MKYSNIRHFWQTVTKCRITYFYKVYKRDSAGSEPENLIEADFCF